MSGSQGLLWVVVIIIATIFCHNKVAAFSEEDARDRLMHPSRTWSSPKLQDQPALLQEPVDHWVQDAQAKLAQKLQTPERTGVAKNVLFYLGDGMSIQTVTAARIFKGQKVDNSPIGGEEAELHMDKLPFTGTSKTFCSNRQVADSACSATAYLCGVKANYGTMGVTPDVPRRSCEGQMNRANHVDSVLAWAQAEGKSTGIITTTRITHASPGATYAHIADRNWESDYNVRNSSQNPDECDDIAEQLILNEPGNKINVILGGGRREFIPNNVTDPEYPNSNGRREDGKNLIQQWINDHPSSSSRYVINRTDLRAVNTASTDYLLGLFEPSHISYRDQQTRNNDPSLEEMVDIAIRILSKNPNGFFLFVEGGRIDHAHHDNLVQRSLWETIEFDNAIRKGDEMTEDEDTLLLVTSDHSHVMQIAGYPTRGNPLLEYVRADGGPTLANDSLPYNTLHYANGPGGNFFTNNETGERRDVSQDNFDSLTYRVPTAIPLDSETHGGDDVLIFAKGPFAHLLTGIHQQSYIPHVVGYAACLGSGERSDSCRLRDGGGDGGGAERILMSMPVWGLLVVSVLSFIIA